MSVGVCDTCERFFLLEKRPPPETPCPRCGGVLRASTRLDLKAQVRLLRDSYLAPARRKLS